MSEKGGGPRAEMPRCPQQTLWAGSWRGRAAAALISAAAALGALVPVAAASSPDVQATHAYLLAQYRLGTALLRQAAPEDAVERAAAAQIARECPGVVSGMPKEPSLGAFPLAPRARGENARLTQQRETIGSEVAAAVTRPDDSLLRPADETYAAEVRQLSWSNPAIAAAVTVATAARLEAVSAPAPPWCADARAWAASGYRALSPASREFEASRTARRNAGQAELSLEALLEPYETASDRALIGRTSALQSKLLATSAATVETVLKVERTLGFPRSETEIPKKPIVLGRGRTAAGTHFEVTTGGGLLSGPGCHRQATVAYSRPGAPEVLIVGGPNNPICLSSPRYRHPAQFCESGIETFQGAVPASVRSVSLLLADGRTIRSNVIRVSRRDGGPSGIYAQELRGSTSHAVSLVEFDAGGGVVLSVGLSRYRCVKPRQEPEGLPTLAELASGVTPEGEPFAIDAFGSINGEPFLSVLQGVNPEVGEPTSELGAGKAFSWSLRVACAPHPYAILYGILLPPGESVTAQTPQGSVALTAVPTEPRVRAGGPLVYGVFGALPSELTVIGAGGATVYTEDLRAKATEVAQFCEGYVEP